MKWTKLIILLIIIVSCKSNNDILPPNVVVTSAMKNVMWKGELDGKIKLDTLNKNGLYGLGPTAFLDGEILINDGRVFVSKVINDSAMVVKENNIASAPFFVHTNIKVWDTLLLQKDVKSINDLQTLLDNETKNIKKPYPFKLIGSVSKANIHVQNLPKGTKVSNPTEAHQGQVNYQIENNDVEIVGFFSRNHKGIFTHHDTFLHMHLITKDHLKMGHLDNVIFEDIILLMPKTLN